MSEKFDTEMGAFEVLFAQDDEAFDGDGKSNECCGWA